MDFIRRACLYRKASNCIELARPLNVTSFVFSVIASMQIVLTIFTEDGKLCERVYSKCRPGQRYSLAFPRATPAVHLAFEYGTVLSSYRYVAGICDDATWYCRIVPSRSNPSRPYPAAKSVPVTAVSCLFATAKSRLPSIGTAHGPFLSIAASLYFTRRLRQNNNAPTSSPRSDKAIDTTTRMLITLIVVAHGPVGYKSMAPLMSVLSLHFCTSVTLAGSVGAGGSASNGVRSSVVVGEASYGTDLARLPLTPPDA